MAQTHRQKLGRKELENGYIPTNHVLIKIVFRAEGAHTKSGIIYGFNEDLTYGNPEDTDTSSHSADLAEVWGVVKGVPNGLYYNQSDPSHSMPWNCDMDLQYGDVVWYNVIEAKNSVEIECENDIYKLIPYQDCYVAKRKGEVICLNGYVLCEHAYFEEKSRLAPPGQKKIDKTRGIIKYFGKPNKRYLRQEYNDFIDLREGDEVVFAPRTPLWYLERQKYNAFFDGDNIYWVVQRRRIAMVWKRKRDG